MQLALTRRMAGFTARPSDSNMNRAAGNTLCVRVNTTPPVSLHVAEMRRDRGDADIYNRTANIRTRRDSRLSTHTHYLTICSQNTNTAPPPPITRNPSRVVRHGVYPRSIQHTLTAAECDQMGRFPETEQAFLKGRPTALSNLSQYIYR